MITPGEFEEQTEDQKLIKKLKEENIELNNKINHMIFEADQLKEEKHNMKKQIQNKLEEQ